MTIERRSNLSAEEFASAYQAGQGRPVILTDAIEKWPAARKWNFDFFKERYGADRAVASDSIVNPTVQERVTLREYIEYVENPGGSRLTFVPSPRPLYLNSYTPFVLHPELLEDFSDPYCIENWYRHMQGPMEEWYRFGFGWIFFGPKGTVTPFHVDLFATHAWLAQIEGRKRCAMVSPAQASCLTDIHLDPFNPDYERYPGFASAEVLDFTLEPGEVLFIPRGWPHYVEGLSPSISLTFNFINASNFGAHMHAVYRDMPIWINKGNTKRLRTHLGIRWVSRGFDYPDTEEEHAQAAQRS